MLVLLVLLFAGCVDSPPWGAWSKAPSAEQIAAVMGRHQETFIYFSRYEVYQTARSHEYVYREGSHWVHSPLPPTLITTTALQHSPAVTLVLDEAPELRHAQVRADYPPDGRDNLGTMASLP
jgi:hypothetical protein